MSKTKRGIGLEPDGEYVPEAPAKLLREGRFHHGIRLMVGQNAAEVGFLQSFALPGVNSHVGLNSIQLILI